MNKRLLSLSILLALLMIILPKSVFGASITSAEIAVTSSKTEYESGEVIEFIISLKNLDASSGILGIGAYIEYDSEVLTLNTSAEGLSGWTDANISENTHRFATTKDTHSSNNEDVLKIKFTPRNINSNIETSITLKKIEISNGSEYDISEVSSSKIVIKPQPSNNENPPEDPNEQPSPTPSTPNDTNNGQNPGNSGNPNDSNNQNNSNTPNTPNGSNGENNSNNGNNNNNNNGNENNNNVNVNNSNEHNNSNNNSANNNPSNNNQSENKAGSSIPKLGANEYILIVIFVVFIISVILFIKIKILNKKIKKKDDFSSKNK